MELVRVVVLTDVLVATTSSVSVRVGRAFTVFMVVIGPVYTKGATEFNPPLHKATSPEFPQIPLYAWLSKSIILNAIPLATRHNGL